MSKITFTIEPCEETGGFVAGWDAPDGGGIASQGATYKGFEAMIADAVKGWFGAEEPPLIQCSTKA
ncbi:MAG TPA: hypothetical protein VF614_03250 [Chthoniobacteraceae bacterium]|jgi:predicted RNase H-like HicB family nuclease